MADPSLLDHLGALREQRAATTTTDLPLPGFEGRLWATFRLPDPAKATQVSALMAAGNSALLSACQDLLARATKGIYTADEDAEAPIHDEDGHLQPAFEHLPGGTDDVPISFATPALERVTSLCPPRPGGKEHTPETRARVLFGSDNLMIAAALNVAAWAIGDRDAKGALEKFSETFRNGDEPAA